MPDTDVLTSSRISTVEHEDHTGAHAESPNAPHARTGAVLAGLSLLIVAFNLRAVVIAVAPLLDDIRAQTGLSSAGASLLTTLPIVCFGLMAPFAPRLARRFGSDRVLWGTMAAISAGILVRLVPSMAVLFAGTVLIGGAIAVANVLVPSLIKRDFPGKMGLMMGLYTMAISGGNALAAGITVPLQELTGFDWRGTLALWAIPAVFAVVALLPRLRIRNTDLPGRTATAKIAGIWRDALAWQVTLFMGLQSLGFFALAAWMPTLFIDAGMSEAEAGFMLSLSAVFGLIASFVMPVLANRAAHQRHLIAAMAAIWTAGLIGLLVAPVGGAVIWMACLGLGQGAALALALSLIVLRSPDARHAAELSGMAQSVGYTLAALGPFVLGLIHDLSGDWTVPLLVLVLLMVPILTFGLSAARNRLIGSPKHPAT